MPWGVAAGLTAVLLYSVASVVQAVAARDAADRAGRAPGLSQLVRSPRWLVGVGVLGLAFVAFVLSTRVLPLPVAEALRSGYLVVTVVLAHAVLRTRAGVGELVGAAVAVLGIGVFVAAGGTHGDVSADGATTLAMVVVLLVAAGIGMTGADRLARSAPVPAGVAEAALAGVCFAVLDLGVRSVPAPFSVLTAMGTPACWVGALAAPVGLVLYARAATRVAVGSATAVMTLVDVVVAAAWSALAFQDTTDAAPALVAVSLVLGVGGVAVMTAAAHREPPATATPP